MTTSPEFTSQRKAEMEPNQLVFNPLEYINKRTPRWFTREQRQAIFIEKAKSIHVKNEYDYSKVNYASATKKVEIVCSKHGSFSMTPDSHITAKQGCPKCTRSKGGYILSKGLNLSFLQEMYPQFDIISKPERLEGNYRVYDEITIFCKEHQRVCKGKIGSLLRGVTCCPECKGVKITERKISKDANGFIAAATACFDGKYDYSKGLFRGLCTPLEIVCPEHGSFFQSPRNHLMSREGCPICAGVTAESVEDILSRANAIYGNKYDLSRIGFTYQNKASKVEIGCSKHGWVTTYVAMLLSGAGCSRCKTSRGEALIEGFLRKEGIVYETQKKFKDCCCKAPLPFDFYLPDYPCCIEYQGVQHFFPVDFFGGESSFRDTQKRDEIKRRYCEDRGILLLLLTENTDIQSLLTAFLSSRESLRNSLVSQTLSPGDQP